MKEHPILFNTAMITAILYGKKFQTRRVIKPQPLWVADPNVPFKTYAADPKGIINCPYGGKDHLLWVKETFSLLGFWDKDMPVHDIGDQNVIYYQESGDFEWQDGNGFTATRKDGTPRSCWKPSIFMKKIYTRIWLKVKTIKVERLQDISTDDAVAEGYEIYKGGIKLPTQWFADLWDSINGEPRKDGNDISWEANPWVWATEFERIHSPYCEMVKHGYSDCTCGFDKCGPCPILNKPCDSRQVDCPNAVNPAG